LEDVFSERGTIGIPRQDRLRQVFLVLMDRVALVAPVAWPW
jgi:hypothetical protein